MIQTIQLIKLCYPFIILAVFFCLYKKDNRITRKFCWRMTMTHSARKLFVIAVLASLILMNWCCYMTDPNWAVLLAAIMTGWLHERKRFWTLTLMLALICYSIPYMNSIFHVLYTLGVASVFYPSERVLRIKNEANSISNLQELLQRIIHCYY